MYSNMQSSQVCTESTGFIKVRNFVKEVNREDILLFWCEALEPSTLNPQP